MEEQKDQEAIRVERIRVRNVLAIRELDLRPGKLTVVSGGNTKGKTSLYEALRSLAGGNDLTLIRDGADKAEVLIELSDGTEVKKKIASKSPRMTVSRTDSDGARTRLQEPATFVRQLVDGFNPIDLVNAKPKDRAEMVLSAMPIEMNVPLVTKICEKAGLEVDLSGHALRAIDRAQTAARRAADRSADNAAARRQTAERLRSANSPLAAKREAIEKEIKEIEDRRTAEMAARDELLAQALAARDEEIVLAREAAERQSQQTTDDTQTTIDVHRADVERLRNQLQIAETQLGEAEDRLASINDELSRTNAREGHAAAERYQAACTEIERSAREARQTIEADIRTAQATEGAVTAAAANMATAEQLQTEAAQTDIETVGLRTAADTLERERVKMLEHMPIEGLGIKDGKIHYQDHAFDRLSGAEQMLLAVRIATLRLGKFRFVCLDGGERLDSEMFTALKECLASEGVQALVTRVADGELAVEGQWPDEQSMANTMASNTGMTNDE